MTSKSASNVSSLKRKVHVVQQVPVPSSLPTPAKQIKKEPNIEKLKVYIFHYCIKYKKFFEYFYLFISSLNVKKIYLKMI